MKRFLFVGIVSALTLFLFYVSAKASCFVALNTGNIRSGPGTNHEIVEQVQRYEVLPFYVTPGGTEKNVDWYPIGDYYKIDGDLKRGWYGGEEKTLQAGEQYFFTIFMEKPSPSYREEPGLLQSVTGKTQKIMHTNYREVYYKPAKRFYKYVHKSIGIILPGEVDQHRKRIESIKNSSWSDEIKDLCVKQKISLGMTKEQVIASWGKPNDINRTVTMRGVSEQWVYGSYGSYAKHKLLYFEDNKLTAWQD